MIYYKTKDNHHFYMKLQKGFLHVSVFDNDTTIVTKNEYLEISSDHFAGDCCINNIDEIPFEVEECSEEIFNIKIKYAIYQLELHDYWNPK